MRKKVFSILQYILFLGAGIFLTWWQLRSMTAEQQKDFEYALKNANYWLMIPVVIMSLLSHLSRSMRWRLLLEPLDYHPKLSNTFAATMVGYFANSAIPRLGEVLKCTFLSRYEKLKFEKVFGTIIVERAFDFVCYIIFIGITVLLQVQLISGYIDKKIKAMQAPGGLPFWAKIILIVAILAIFLIGLSWLRKKYPENKLIGKVNTFIRGIITGFSSIKNLKKKKLFLAHTLFIWAMYLLQIYIGFFAMQGTTGLGINAAFSVLSLATLAMIASPGGIGFFPWFVMETLLLYGIGSPQGYSFGWLIWGANTAIVIVAGIISLLLFPYMNRKKEMHLENVH